VDDHPLYLESMGVLLAQHGFSIAGKATNASDALDLVEEHRPNIVVLDLHLPRADGLRCLEVIRGTYPEIVVVVLSGSEDEEDIRTSLARGAHAYVLKAGAPDDVVTAIRQATKRSVYLSPPEGSMSFLPGPSWSEWNLTRREAEILRLAAEGFSNAELAGKLWITEQTVKYHLSNVYRKLGVSNRTEASRVAESAGFLRDVDREVS
jgi:two-component system NarL family response regulator